MGIASISGSINNRGLGLPQGTVRPLGVVGCSSSGTVDSPTMIYSRDQAISTFGHGPLVEALCFLLRWAGGPFVATRVTTATAGSAGSVTRAGTGADGDAWAMSVSGTPRDAYSVKVKVTRYGATIEALTAAIRYSIDGGLTYFAEQPVPSSGAVVLGDTGLTVTFNDGSDADEAFVDDVYSFTCTAPVYDATGLGTALAAMKTVANPLWHDGVLVVGHVVDTTFGTVKTAHDALIAAAKPRWFMVATRDQDVAGSESNATYVAALLGGTPGFAGLNADLIARSFGYALTDSEGIGGIWRRPVAWHVAAALAKRPLHHHPGRVASGALPGIRDAGLLHDISASAFSAMDTGGFIGAQVLEGLDGYIATDRTAAAPGSDFATAGIMRARVVCYATRVLMQRCVAEVNIEREVNADGTLTAAEADALDAALTSYMVNEVKNPRLSRGYCSDVGVSVSRTANIRETGQIPVRLRISPLAYSTQITIEAAFAASVRS
jgi:hypothetical protein